MTNLYEGLPIVSWPVHPDRTRKRRVDELPPHALVLHTSEQMFPTSTSAESLARAIGSAPVTTNGHTNQASYHWAVDLDTIAALVPPDDIAYHAPPNAIGEAICLTGRAGRDWTGTSDGVDDWPELRLTARLAARRCAARGWPVRRLTVDQLRRREPGICEHFTVSQAFGKTDHTDVGPGFPWVAFLELVADELPPSQEDFPMHLALSDTSSPPREAMAVHDGDGISMIGFATPADRDKLIAAYDAKRVVVSPAQFDDYLAHAADDA